MADIEKSFVYLHDTIPSWFKDIASIEEKVTRMQEEMSQMPAQHSRSIKKKTNSVESIRDLDDIRESANKPSPLQLPQVSTRKRKPASLASGTSGPSRHRSRAMMIIVYYDGQVQKQFETLVRSIGTGRNLLRKGKMAARAQALADLASSDDDRSDSDGDGIMAKIQFRRKNGLSSMRAYGPLSNGQSDTSTSTATPEALFDSTDKLLEQAQTLCERAAHQSLREGDCRKELAGMRRYFLEVQETASKEVAKHNAQKEREATAAANQETTTTESASSPSVPEPVLQPRLAPQPPKRMAPALPTAPSGPKDMVLEIDDDDDDDDRDFVMPPVRLMPRA